MTRIYYDTEFIEDGRTIELISIGLVSGAGGEYYAVNSDAPWARIKAHDWLMRNVVPSLPLRGRNSLDRYVATPHNSYPKPPLDLLAVDTGDSNVKPHWVIANEVRDIIQSIDDPQLWAWYGAYDHVALAQLWGRMIDLPEGVPMWTNDLEQEAMRLGNPPLPEQPSGEHNALADARHVREMAAVLLNDGS